MYNNKQRLVRLRFPDKIVSYQYRGFINFLYFRILDEIRLFLDKDFFPLSQAQERKCAPKESKRVTVGVIIKQELKLNYKYMRRFRVYRSLTQTIATFFFTIAYACSWSPMKDI